MPHQILCFGEILWDMLPDGPALGGAPFNLAARLAGLGEKAIIASKVGEDDLGHGALIKARSLGVDVSLVQTDPDRPTGTVEVTLRDGDPDFHIVTGVAYDWIEMTADLDRAASAADCICFGTLIQRSECSRHALQTMLYMELGVMAFCDINLRRDCYSEDTVNESLLRADILKLNESEVEVVSEMLMEQKLPPLEFASLILEEYNPRMVLVTLGKNGVLAVPANSDPVYVPGYGVNVVDTVGSGDAFSAGFLHRFLDGATPADACDFGSRLGALAASRAGGTEKITGDELTEIASASTRYTDPRFEQYSA